MSCPDCFKGHVHEGEPRGKITKLHGLDAYITEPADGRSVKAIIVIIPDAFGWDFVNNRLLADHYADRGDYRVYLPDFMNGHSAPVWMIDAFRLFLSPGNYLSKLYNIPFVAYGVVPFLYHNGIGKSHPRVKAFFQALRSSDGGDDAALPVGAAGFCWGGKHTVLLAAADAEKVNGRPPIDAGFTGHPSMLEVPADIEKVALPVAFAIGEKDPQVSLEQAAVIKKIVEAKPEGQTGELVVYEGVGHGFCVRADTAALDAAAQAAAAEDQCIRWFNKHLGLGA